MISSKRMLSFCMLALTASAVHAQETTIKWRTDYNAARAEAEAKNLPMLIDFITISCLYCDKMDQVTFSDPGVINLTNERFIPVKIDCAINPSLAMYLRVDRFPTIVLCGSDGLILDIRVGYQDAGTMHDILRQTLVKLAPIQEKHLAGLANPDRDWMKKHDYLTSLIRRGMVWSLWPFGAPLSADPLGLGAVATKAPSPAPMKVFDYDRPATSPSKPAAPRHDDPLATVVHREPAWSIWPFTANRPAAPSMKVFDFDRLPTSTANAKVRPPMQVKSPANVVSEPVIVYIVPPANMPYRGLTPTAHAYIAPPNYLPPWDWGWPPAGFGAGFGSPLLR